MCYLLWSVLTRGLSLASESPHVPDRAARPQFASWSAPATTHRSATRGAATFRLVIASDVCVDESRRQPRLGTSMTPPVLAHVKVGSKTRQVSGTQPMARAARTRLAAGGRPHHLIVVTTGHPAGGSAGTERMAIIEPDIEVVAEVASGDDVLPAARKHRADVAVLDIDLPGKDGLTAATEIHEHLPDCRCPPAAQWPAPNPALGGPSRYARRRRRL